MNKKKLLVQGTISIISIIGIAYGRLVSVPDAVSRLYGFPYNWCIHQRVTIAGPVDVWRVNITYLVFDLVFWMIIMLIFPIILIKDS
jgi:hypothetical protein